MSTHEISAEGRSARRGGRWLVFPEYGLVDAILGFAMFYVVVATVTDPMAEGLAGILGVDPDAIRTWFAIGLWIILGLTVLGQLTKQLKDNPHRFSTDDARRAFLERRRPGPLRYLGAILATTVGAAIAWLLIEEFLMALVSLAIVIVGPATITGISLWTVIWLVSFSIGFGLFTFGLDRLVIGLVRDLIAIVVIGGNPDASAA